MSFKGAAEDVTLKNILSKQVTYLKLDCKVEATAQLRDLVVRLLERDPRRRIGSARAAAEIKRHPFFTGVDWALIRCARDAAGPGSKKSSPH
jgi:hypothetical protein